MNKNIIIVLILIITALLTFLMIPNSLITVVDEINNQMNPNIDSDYFKYYYYNNITDSERNIWADASKVSYKSFAENGSSHDPYIAYKYIKENKNADCYGMTAYLYYRFNFEEYIPARDIVYHSNSSKSGTHHTIQLYIHNKWINPYYGYKHLNYNFSVGQSAIENNYTVYRNPPDSYGNIPNVTSEY